MSAKPNDSRIVNKPLPKSVLLKDYLLDDLSSCSSNGFRSYPRRQCCTKVRYLIEIDLNKHIKLQPTHKQFLKSRSKSKSTSSVLNKASAAVVNVFKSFNFSGTGSGDGKHRKANLLPRNLSRKMSKNGFWKRTIDRSKLSSDEAIKRKEIVLPVVEGVSGGVAAATAEVKTLTSNSNSNSSESVDSYFTATSDCSTTGDSLKNNVAQKVVEEGDELVVEKMNPVIGENAAVVTLIGTGTGTDTDRNAKEKSISEEKDHFSPNSVMNFPCDDDNGDEDEVTSPFHDIYLYVEGSKQKVTPKVQRTMTLKPVRLEDRITLSESNSHDTILKASLQETQSELEEYQKKKKAIALLQLFKATMPYRASFESTVTESFLLEFFSERVIEGNVSNYAILQDAKDWVNGLTRGMFDSDNYKLIYIRDLEKRAKWLTYDYEVEKEVVVSELEYEVITSLVEEMLLDLYL